MKDLVPGSQRDLVWHWLRAELESSRYARSYGFLNPDLSAKVFMADKASITDEEWMNLAQALFYVRAPLLKGLLRQPTTWYTGTMSLSEIPDLKVMWPAYLEISPNHNLRDLVTAIDAGQVPKHEKKFVDNYKQFRDVFKYNPQTGWPILIGEKKEGPYLLLEGYTRFSVLTSKFLKGELPDASIPVVLGLSDRLDDWYLDDNTHYPKLAVALRDNPKSQKSKAHAH